MHVNCWLIRIWPFFYNSPKLILVLTWLNMNIFLSNFSWIAMYKDELYIYNIQIPLKLSLHGDQILLRSWLYLFPILLLITILYATRNDRILWRIQFCLLFFLKKNNSKWSGSFTIFTRLIKSSTIYSNPNSKDRHTYEKE